MFGFFLFLQDIFNAASLCVKIHVLHWKVNHAALGQRGHSFVKLGVEDAITEVCSASKRYRHDSWLYSFIEVRIFMSSGYHFCNALFFCDPIRRQCNRVVCQYVRLIVIIPDVCRCSKSLQHTCTCTATDNIQSWVLKFKRLALFITFLVSNFLLCHRVKVTSYLSDNLSLSCCLFDLLNYIFSIYAFNLSCLYCVSSVSFTYIMFSI